MNMDLQRANAGGGGKDIADGVTMTRFCVNQVNDNPVNGLVGSGSPPSPAPVNHNYNDLAHRDSYILSLRQLTKETTPRIDLYRNTRSITYANRPTLEELHNGTVVGINGQNGFSNGALQLENGKPVARSGEHGEGDGGGGGHHIKFGWIEGVLVLNLMSLWGPMLFLRTSWLVGQGGIIEACLVILFSSLITTITALSTSAIATNGEVKGGGTYYMLSRSLGAEYGGAIGLIFAFANMVGVAMNIVGFCEALGDLLQIFNMKIVDGGINDTRIIGIAAVAFCLTICIIGMEWEQKAQSILLVVLLTAITDVIIGSFIPPDEEKKSMGITGWNLDVAAKNVLPDFRGETFFTLFAIYFPSSTGILSGANISGELKDPQSSIPKGTLLAILITTSSYVFFAIISGFCIIRDAGGFVNGTLVEECGPNFLVNGTLVACQYGLQNRYQMLEVLSAFRWLIYAGNFAATISSALACLVGAPRVFQALCRDKIYPYIYWFEKGYGKSDDPYRCYALTFVIASAFILIGDLDSIAPIMSNFFMAAFALINFAVFHAAFAKSPGFRPSFKYWNMWVSAFGSVLCFVVMFIMDWMTAIITVVICFFLYLYLYYNKPAVNWGSSAQAETYRQALRAAQELNITEEHVKNYRPHILVLSGKPSSRPQLVDFAYTITKGIGLTIAGHVVRTPGISQRRRNEMETEAYRWMNSRKCKAFYSSIEDVSLENGAKALIQSVGVGKLRPNMLMMGYKSNWQMCNRHDVLEYFCLLHGAFDRYLGVGILRMPQGLDYSYFTEEGEMLSSQSTNTLNVSQMSLQSGGNVMMASNGSMASLNSVMTLDSSRHTPITSPKDNRKKNARRKSANDIMSAVPIEIQDNINWFQKKQNGTIDVWWLYDDGGLTLLIPYILSTRKAWQRCKLRVFSLANSHDQLGEEERNMAALLSKFRIDCTEVTVLADLRKPAAVSTVREFYDILDKFRETTVVPATDSSDDDANDKQSRITITQAEIEEHKERSNRYMRVREHLKQQSTQSSMIVMTLPMPRKNRVPAALYMAWLEILTKDMPPFLLIRGNQASVLTFYS